MNSEINPKEYGEKLLDMNRILARIEEILYLRTLVRKVLVFVEKHGYTLAWLVPLVFIIAIFLGAKINSFLFDIIVGALTVFALLYAIFAVLTHFDRITNFRTLLNRTISLFKEADNTNSYVCFVCFYPTFGSASLLREKILGVYIKALKSFAARIPIIILYEADDRWKTRLKKFCKFYEIGDEETNETIEVTSQVLNVVDQNWAGQNLFQVKRLPDYHLIFSRTRGIIFTPYYLPDYPAENEVGTRPTPAEIIGVETIDPEVLKRFEDTFRFYANQGPIADIVATLECAQPLVHE